MTPSLKVAQLSTRQREIITFIESYAGDNQKNLARKLKIKEHTFRYEIENYFL